MATVPRILCTLFTALLQLAFAQPAASAQSAAAYMTTFQKTLTHRMVERCGQEVPSLRRTLDAELLDFDKKFEVASAAALALSAKDIELSMPVAPELASVLDAIEREVLSFPKSVGPKAYCEWFVGSLRALTSEVIIAKNEAAFARYKANVARKASPK